MHHEKRQQPPLLRPPIVTVAPSCSASTGPRTLTRMRLPSVVGTRYATSRTSRLQPCNSRAAVALLQPGPAWMRRDRHSVRSPQLKGRPMKKTRKIRRLGAGLAAPVTLAACGSGADNPQDAAESTPSSPATTAAPAATTVPAEPTSSAAPDTTVMPTPGTVPATLQRQVDELCDPDRYAALPVRAGIPSGWARSSRSCAPPAPRWPLWRPSSCHQSWQQDSSPCSRRRPRRRRRWIRPRLPWQRAISWPLNGSSSATSAISGASQGGSVSWAPGAGTSTQPGSRPRT
jgi:hypothetical protein